MTFEGQYDKERGTVTLTATSTDGTASYTPPPIPVVSKDEADEKLREFVQMYRDMGVTA
jgi:hypothetical protein